MSFAMPLHLFNLLNILSIRSKKRVVYLLPSKYNQHICLLTPPTQVKDLPAVQMVPTGLYHHNIFLNLPCPAWF